MKQSTTEWLEFAESDYDVCLYLYKGAKYPQSVYFLCQAIEKVLKARIIEFTDKTPPKIHRLEKLGDLTKLNFSNKHLQILKFLSRDYSRVRYPDYQRSLYNTKTKVSPIFKQGKEVYQWILNKLNNH